MQRRTDPRATHVVAFILGAAVLLNGLLAGGAELVRRYGFGLADLRSELERDDALEVDIRKDPQSDYQVVEIERPEVEQVPLKTRFRSEFNSRVSKETQARIKTLQPLAVVTGSEPPSEESALEPEPRAIKPPQPGVDLNPKREPSPLAMRRRAPSPRAEGTRGKRQSPWKRKLTLRNLTPSNGVLQKVIPQAFPDYLKDIDYGNKTLLNTKEWQFASFFNRVKRAVAQHWHPDREYSRRDPTGNVYGFKTRFTILHIILHPNGTLKKIVLERPCGLTFLDDEATRAFKKAAPFPNPPRRLVNPKTNQIAFRFGFIFEITRSPSWRLFRLK